MIDTQIIQYLNEQGACDEAIEFIHEFNSFEQAYAACENGEWLNWLYTKCSIETPAMKAAREQWDVAREQWDAAWKQLDVARKQWDVAREQWLVAREQLDAMCLTQKPPWPIVEKALQAAIEQEKTI